MTPHAVKLARGWVGTPYLHQASVRGVGCDCLGLIRGVWRDIHGTEPAAVPPYTPDWSEPGRVEVLATAAARYLFSGGPAPRPGDVVLFRMAQGAVAKHLGILANDGPSPTFIHAYSGHGVVESALTPPWARRIAAHFAFEEGS